MRYAEALGREADERDAYRHYVAEQLRLKGEGKYVPKRLWDILHPRPDWDAEAVKEGVIARAGLEVEHEPA